MTLPRPRPRACRARGHKKESAMIRQMKTLPALAACGLLLGLAACNSPTVNSAERTLDRNAGTNTSGAYPSQSDGTRNNPPGTAAERALDKAAGTNTSGAYPAQSDGTRVNPPGTATSRAYDRATDSNTSGAYPTRR
jgi:hypothetical protein